MVDDRCVPWDPVPAYANRWFEIGVAHFEVKLHQGIELASAVAFAPKPNGISRGYHGLNAWLITFERVLAFRYRLIPTWEGATPLPRPRPLNGIDLGAWEVSPSSWLAEIHPPAYPYPVCHFVLTYDESVYEIAASAWKSAQLPDTWELTYQLQPNHST